MRRRSARRRGATRWPDEPRRHRWPRRPPPRPAMELRLTARRGENVLVTIVIPVVVLLFFASVAVLPTGSGPAGRLPPARRPGAGGHRDQPRQPRDRDRLRAQLRGPQAARWLAVDARRAAHGEDAGGPRRRDRAGRRCSSAIAAAVLGWRPGPGASPALFVVALLLGTLAFAGLGLLHGRRAAGRGDPGPGQRPVHRVPAAGRHRDPGQPSARTACHARRAAAGGGPRRLVPGRRWDRATRSTSVGRWRPSLVWGIGAVVLALRTFRWE